MPAAGQDENQCFLVGRLGKDPTKRFTQNGRPVVNFPLATDTTTRDKPYWHRVVVWGRLADTAENYCYRGQRVLIRGEIQYDSWVDSEERTHYVTQIEAERIKFLDSSGNSNNQQQGEETAEAGAEG